MKCNVSTQNIFESFENGVWKSYKEIFFQVEYVSVEIKVRKLREK